MAPVAFTSRLWLGHVLRQQAGRDSNPIFQQPRLGTAGAVFVIQKLRTLDSETGRPLNRTAGFFRQYGLDETVQGRNIFERQMSVVGYRPLPLAEQAAVFDSADPRLVDRWKEVVLPTRPGLVSSFSLLNHHESNDPQAPPLIDRAGLLLESDIQDVLDGSLVRDIAMVGRVLDAMVTGQM